MRLRMAPRRMAPERALARKRRYRRIDACEYKGLREHLAASVVGGGMVARASQGWSSIDRWRAAESVELNFYHDVWHPISIPHSHSRRPSPAAQLN